MNISLILIGNEILQGKIQDKNSHFVAMTLYREHHHLQQVLTIGDQLELMKSVFIEAFKQSDVVITSGGLGPTEDDLTKKALAQTFDLQLEHSDLALAVTQKNYQRNSREYSPRDSQYHIFPKNCLALNNPVGNAPGIAYLDYQKKKAFFALPGVPLELQQMLTQEVLPHIQKLQGRNQLQQKSITAKTFGTTESLIFSHKAPHLWNELAKLGDVSSLPHYLGVDIGVRVQAQTPQELAQKEKQAREIIANSPVGPTIWHWGHESMAEVLLQRAQEKSLTIGFVESCTGGLAASLITDIPGCSQVFNGSIISYSNQVKKDILKVQEQTLKQWGAVSEQTAQEMALGGREQLKSDLVAAFSGIAGPSGAVANKPVGTVAIAIASPLGVRSKTYKFSGDRINLKNRFTMMGLYELIMEIDQLSGS